MHPDTQSNSSETLENAPQRGLIDQLAALPDPRINRRKLHLLGDVVFIGIVTLLCGGEHFTDMEAFGKAKEPWLRKVLQLLNGIPCTATISFPEPVASRENVTETKPSPVCHFVQGFRSSREAGFFGCWGSRSGGERSEP